MSDVRELKDRAAACFERGRFAKAAELLAEAVRIEPRDLACRQKLAEALRRAGDADGAVRVYREVADRYAANGQLIKAVALCKVILEIDPAHRAVQASLAALYARRGAAPAPPPAPEDPGTATGETLPPAPLGKLEMQPLAADVASDGLAFRLEGGLDSPYEQIVAAARGATAAGVRDPAAPAAELEQAAATLSPGPSPLELGPPPLQPGAPLEAGPAPPGPPAEPSGGDPALEPPAAAPRLPSIPLFSDLSPEAFVELSARLVLHRVPAGELVLREGDPGTSFFVVASGRVRVEKASTGGALVLAHLGEGAFFGEMAVLSGGQRVASIVAEEPCELLEIRAEVLEELARAHPHVAASLTKFYRQRLLANAMATSPLFRPFERRDRIALMWRFRPRDAAAGEVIVREGALSDGLYVVLSGEVDVTRGGAGGDRLVARLAEGDVFGEMSCLRKAQASANVIARRGARLLWLPRAAFDEVIAAYPPVLEVVAGLSDQRQRTLDALAGGGDDSGEMTLV